MGFKGFVALSVIAILASSLAFAQQVNVHNATAKANVVMGGGSVVSNHAHYVGNLLITSNEMTFSHSMIKGSITVKSKKKLPVILLKCGTHVIGDIIFSDEEGVVKKSNDSIISGKVLHGAVEIIQSQEKCD